MPVDVLLVHPPTVYDFREKTLFPGPLARTVPQYTFTFLMFPLGLVSMGDYLQRSGYTVRIVNLAERMLYDERFDVEAYLKGVEARIFGIDLHWCVHAQGAIEIAKLCKKHHPHSFVVLGGMTASVFHRELVQACSFVDGVVRGEGEEPLLRLTQAVERGKVSDVPNLTARENGRVRCTPLMKVCPHLDDYSFTELNLVETQRSLFFQSPDAGSWSLPICRGCTLNCVSCGGSAYSYRRWLGRETPAFRSPETLVQDLTVLNERNIKHVFLFQDIRLGGTKYVDTFLKTFRREKADIDHLTMELFYPASREHLQKLASLPVANTINFTISPESGVDRVRRAQGRAYSTDDLLKMAQTCVDMGVTLTNFFMMGLAEETEMTIKQTWRLWDKLLSLNRGAKPSIFIGFGPMLLLDPGSLAFDAPQKFGYHLRFKSLRDYQRALLHPSWKHYFSYETEHLSTHDRCRLILDSEKTFAELCHKYRLISHHMAKTEINYIRANKILLAEIEGIIRIKDPQKQEERLRAIRKDLYKRPHEISSTWILRKQIIHALRRTFGARDSQTSTP